MQCFCSGMRHINHTFIILLLIISVVNYSLFILRLIIKNLLIFFLHWFFSLPIPLPHLFKFYFERNLIDTYIYTSAVPVFKFPWNVSLFNIFSTCNEGQIKENPQFTTFVDLKWRGGGGFTWNVTQFQVGNMGKSRGYDFPTTDLINKA